MVGVPVCSVAAVRVAVVWLIHWPGLNMGAACVRDKEAVLL